MRDLKDLSDEAKIEYRKLLDSDLFSAKQIEIWVDWVTDHPDWGLVGLSQRKMAEMTGRGESSITKWRRANILSALYFGYELLYPADEIIKAMKIEKVQNGKVVWKSE